MLHRILLLVVASWPWFASSTALAAPTLSLAVGGSPPLVAGRPLVTDQLDLSLQITSPYEIASIAVNAGSLSTSLPAGATAGLIDVTSLARGVHVVSVVVTDALGAEANASLEFFLNHSPVLSSSEPVEGQVVRGGSFSARITCQDDDPLGCSSLRVSGVGFEPLESTSGVINASISVDNPAIGNGSTYQLLLEATDSDGAMRVMRRHVVVERSAGLDLVENTLGAVLDFDATRMLVRTADDGLALVPRGSGQATMLASGPGIGEQAALTTTGALWIESVGNWAGHCTRSTVLWHLLDGQPVRVGQTCDHAPFFVSSSEALSQLFETTAEGEVLVRFGRRDAASGHEQLGPTWPRPEQQVPQGFIWASNGDVFGYVDDPSGPATLTRVFRDHEGTLDEIGSVPYAQGTRLLPHTDGSVVALVRNDTELWVADVAANGGFQQIGDLAPYSHAAGGGRLAYSQPGDTGIRHVWLQEQGGTPQRVTFYGSDTDVEAVDPAGRVLATVLGSAPAGADPEAGEPGQRGRYLIDSESPTQARWLISHFQGRVFLRCDGWYLAIGSGLLRFNQPELQSSFPCPEARAPAEVEPDAGLGSPGDAGQDGDGRTPDEDGESDEDDGGDPRPDPTPMTEKESAERDDKPEGTSARAGSDCAVHPAQGSGGAWFGLLVLLFAVRGRRTGA
jgi:MYXO-CTERM domain-containing protein